MAKGKVLQTVVQIAGEISPTLGKSLEAVQNKLEGVNLKAVAAGAAVGGIAVGTAVKVGKAVKGLAQLGDSYNSAMNDLSATTGIVGDELAAMGDVVKDVYKDNFGESMGDVASGVAEIHKQTGLVEDELKATTEAAYLLSDTFGYDINESARAAKAMMTNFGVSGEEALGLIAAGAQNGLDYSGELVDSVNEYSVQFKKLGFSADEMFNIFQQGADNGAWNLDKVGDAIKEFSIRSIDGSKGTTEAFQALGLNAEDTMSVFAAGGEGANEMFKTVAKKLVALDDQVERDALGVALFGTMWEDLGIDAVKALSEVDDAAYNTEDSLQKINDVKYSNLSDAWGAIKRNAEVALLPLASTIAKAFTDMAPMIGSLFEQLGPIIEQVTTDIMPFVTEFLGGIMEILPEIIPILSELAEAIMPILGDLVKKLLPPLLELIKKILPPIMEIVEAILPVLSEILLAILPILTDLLSMILPVILELLESLLPIIKPLLSMLQTLLKDVIFPILEPLMAMVQELLPAIAPILGAIADALSPVLKILEPIAEVLGVIVGWISDIIGWVADGFGWVVDIFTGGVSKDDVSGYFEGFATGGLTNGVSIAGEDPRYPNEWVISPNPAYRAQNLSYWAQAGRMLGADVSDYTLETSNASVSLGGITFAPNITINGSADKQSIMQAIEEEYPEFIDMLEEWFAKRGVTVYG